MSVVQTHPSFCGLFGHTYLVAEEIRISLMKTYVSHRQRHTYLIDEDIRISSAKTYVSHRQRHTYLIGKDIRISLAKTYISHWQRHTYLIGKDIRISFWKRLGSHPNMRLEVFERRPTYPRKNLSIINIRRTRSLSSRMLSKGKPRTKVR